MTIHDPINKPFVPGTTSWRAEDLDDPEIEKLWMRGRYEIVEGVLATRASHALENAIALWRLVSRVSTAFEKMDIAGEFACGVDMVLAEDRVAVADAMFLTSDQMASQRLARAKAPKGNLKYGRIIISPMLLIESVDVGHESHDRRLKRRWYAEWGVANYWILDAKARSLECLRLDGQAYFVDQTGRANDILHPSAFAGLEIALSQIWI